MKTPHWLWLSAYDLLRSFQSNLQCFDVTYMIEVYLLIVYVVLYQTLSQNLYKCKNDVFSFIPRTAGWDRPIAVVSCIVLSVGIVEVVSVRMTQYSRYELSRCRISIRESSTVNVNVTRSVVKRFPRTTTKLRDRIYDNAKLRRSVKSQLAEWLPIRHCRSCMTEVPTRCCQLTSCRASES